jgi:hypothetical protein
MKISTFRLVVAIVIAALSQACGGGGGNFVVILPNGISAFRYADGDVHDPAALALATADIRSFC